MGGCLSQSQALPNPEKVDLSHFYEYQPIGRGGFGTVSAVARRDPDTGEPIPSPLYALKRMSKEKIVQQQVNVDMIWREREIMVINGEFLDSPFLCQLHWAFQSQTELFLVMEFMQGGDLRFQMRKKGNVQKLRPLAEPVARFYLAEILLALRALHSANIVYRDLKPENALLDSDGHLRLADFGIATVLLEQNGFKTSGRSGTYAYMSPEMLSREEYGVEVDVWAFGVTMFELLHAELPFAPLQPGSSSEKVARHFRTTPRTNSTLSPPAKHLLSRLLNPDRSKRLTSVKEVLEHPFFADVPWPEIKKRAVKPPITPEPGFANCTATAALEVAFLDDPPKPVAPHLEALFVDFEYERPRMVARRGTVGDVTTAGMSPELVAANRLKLEAELAEMGGAGDEFDAEGDEGEMDEYDEDGEYLNEGDLPYDGVTATTAPGAAVGSGAAASGKGSTKDRKDSVEITRGTGRPQQVQ